MAVPTGSDTLTCAQLMSAMQGMSMQELGAAFEAMERRYPRLRGRLVMSMGGYGAEASPIGLAGRSEWVQLLRQGKTFGMVGALAASPGNFTVFQLFNPAGSSVRLLVYIAGAELGTGSDVLVTQDPTVIGGGATGVATNLLFGSAIAAQGQGRSSTPVAVPGNIVSRFPAAASTAFAIAPSPQGFLCEIPPGQGIDIVPVIPNCAMTANIFWAEVPLLYA